MSVPPAVAGGDLVSKSKPHPLPQVVLTYSMAFIEDKLRENTPGRFYVDRQCIDCDVCRDTAPANFARNDEDGYSYVKKQPQNQQEYDLCREAFDACPVEAIGDDGVSVTSLAA